MSKYMPLIAFGLLTLSSGVMAAGQASHPASHAAMSHAEPGTETRQREAFRTLDSNGDGKLSKAELPARHPMAGHFGMMDRNEDGTLSEAEYLAH